MRKIAVFFLVAMVLGNCVCALGIAPASKVIEPGKEDLVEYRIYNSEKKEFVAEITVNGSLADYIVLDQQEIRFTKGDRFKRFTARITLPENPARGLSASINVKGGFKQISAELTLADQETQIPTGKAVQDPKKEAPAQEEPKQPADTETNKTFTLLIQAVLGVIIFGNILYFVARKATTGKRPKIRRIKTKQPKSPEQLRTEILELKHELDTFDFVEQKHL